MRPKSVYCNAVRGTDAGVQKILGNIEPKLVCLLETLGEDRVGHWALFELITLSLFVPHTLIAETC